jgi:hypothetical protein
MTLSISISPSAEAKLREKAAAIGQPLDEYASRVLEQEATKPTVDEVLAPFRKQVAESGMSDDELDDFFEGVREQAFQERRRRQP